MKTELTCIPCFVRQSLEAISLVTSDDAQRESLMRRVLRDLSEMDWAGTPPAIAQRLHRMLRGVVGSRDPYFSVKDQMNRAALDMLPVMREALKLQPDVRAAAVRVAIGGNLLDAGAKTQIAAEELPEHLNSIWSQPLRGDVQGFFEAASRAERILYLADNAGEIVLDRLLIEALPMEKITLVVRGVPVINDATMEDAVLAGLPDLVRVTDNGSDAPGTVLEDCSDEFMQLWDQADLVISKGQGNFETLSGVNKPIYFLFIVKCSLVAEMAKAPVGCLVIRREEDV
ncbi:MAG: ARMT1-like domain-containing protein [Kiritimatiellae bacterium]|nr:ARMT1-like domain-containing protein [Kiritimatiellia bacterium]